jgi:hypothetical protein
MHVHATDDENVEPAITINVVNEGEKTIGRRRWFREFDSGIDFVSSFESGTFVPERTSNDVLVSVLIKVTVIDAVAVVLAGQGELLEPYR